MCVTVCTHSCIQESVDFECVDIVCRGDKVQMTPTLIGVLCSDEEKLRLEAIYAEMN